MSYSKNNKYLKCISNRVGALIYLITLFLLFAFVLVIKILEKEWNLVHILLIIGLALILLFIAFDIYNVCKGDKVIYDDYTSKKDFYILLVVTFILLIIIIGIVFYRSNNTDIMAKYRTRYEKIHPNDAKLNDSELIGKYRYANIKKYVIIYLILTFYEIFRQITYNQYIEETEDKNHKSNYSRSLENGYN